MWPGVAYDAAKFLRNVLWYTIQNQEQGYQHGVTRPCVHVRVSRVDHVQDSIGLLLKDNLCPHAASHVCSECDRDEGARGEDIDGFALPALYLEPLLPPMDL